MFIELTDHLRCPNDHDESFLVLLPDRIEDRSVLVGQLGCPICGRTFQIDHGIFDTGDAPEGGSNPGTALDAEAVTALSGLHGPGGYLTLVGGVASRWREIAELSPGVALVAVNAGQDVTEAPGISLIRSGRLPLKSRSMRGVVLGRPYADQPGWVAEAARVVLPGLRVVGEGAEPPTESIELMASADGVWVGTASLRRTTPRSRPDAAAPPAGA